MENGIIAFVATNYIDGQKKRTEKVKSSVLLVGR